MRLNSVEIPQTISYIHPFNSFGIHLGLMDYVQNSAVIRAFPTIGIDVAKQSEQVKYRLITYFIKSTNPLPGYFITRLRLLDVYALNIPNAPLLKLDTGLAGATGGPPFPSI